MQCFFDPKSVAIIGASRDAKRGGHRILKNVKAGFQGAIYVINPQCEEVDGLRCYASVRDIPGPVDLAIVYVPARLVPGVVRECAAHGVRGVIIESAGFAEVGAEGKALQDELKLDRQQGGRRRVRHSRVAARRPAHQCHRHVPRGGSRRPALAGSVPALA